MHQAIRPFLLSPSSEGSVNHRAPSHDHHRLGLGVTLKWILLSILLYVALNAVAAFIKARVQRKFETQAGPVVRRWKYDRL
jgi:hypothetical protein